MDGQTGIRHDNPLAHFFTQVFRRQHGGESDPSQSGEAVGKSWTELADLERNFLERVAETTSKLKHGGGGAGAASG